MGLKQRVTLAFARGELVSQAEHAAARKLARLSDAERRALSTFRAECCTAERSKKIDGSNEQDWFSLSLGFFVAKGLTPSQAHKLARLARYDLQYWHYDLTADDLKALERSS